MQMRPSSNISILGTGYVGLVTGLCLAECGHNVVAVDVDAEKIAALQQGKSPIYEKGINELLTRQLGRNFSASTDLRTAVMLTDISIIAVGTPFRDGQIDLTDIKNIARELGESIKAKEEFHLIVVKSTVTPGTTNEVILPLLEQASGKKAGIDFGLCMNPEFLREGNAVNDFLNPDRIVIGGIDQNSIDALAAVYLAFKDTQFIKTNNRTAELIKYASNSLFATMISFANEIANLCAKTEKVDVMDVMRGVCADKRITFQAGNTYLKPGLVDYLKPGCGFGGSCFPKDLNALVAYGNQLDLDMPLLKAALAINDAQPMHMLSYLNRHYKNLQGVNVGILGIAFKPETNDIRSSPALVVIEKLVEAGANVHIYDPVVKKINEKYAQKVQFLDTLKDLVCSVDAALIFTAWDEFQTLPELINLHHKDLIVIDGRRMLEKKRVKHYEGIGL